MFLFVFCLATVDTKKALRTTRIAALAAVLKNGQIVNSAFSHTTIGHKEEDEMSRSIETTTHRVPTKAGKTILRFDLLFFSN